jgi:hypothetical protein
MTDKPRKVAYCHSRGRDEFEFRKVRITAHLVAINGDPTSLN